MLMYQVAPSAPMERLKYLCKIDYKNAELWKLLNDNLVIGVAEDDAKKLRNIVFNTLIRSTYTNKVVVRDDNKILINYGVVIASDCTLSNNALELAAMLNAFNSYKNKIKDSVDKELLARSVFQPLGIVYTNCFHVVSNVIVNDEVFDTLEKDSLFEEGYRAMPIEDYVPKMGTLEELVHNSLVIVGVDT